MSSSTPSTGLRIDVASLRRVGARREVELDAPIPDLGAGLTRVPADRPVHARLEVQRIDEGVVVRGTVAAEWDADCARCLDPVHGRVEVHVDELFEPVPEEGDTYPLEGDEVDAEQMLRDALTLEFPLAPAGPVDERGRCTVCGRRIDEIVRPDEPRGTDPRWAALDALDL
jgi:uncharacterized protein